MGVQFWQEISNFVIGFIFQWNMKGCEETNLHGRALQCLLNYMTQPRQVLALPARSEQYGLIFDT